MTGPLHRLVYRSDSLLAGTRAECDAQVAAILQTSRANNVPAGLTGILLFDGAMFLQVIEGTLPEIERVHEVISCDNRHEELEILDLVPVEQREYDSWAMAYIDETDPLHEPLRRVLSSKDHWVGAGLGGTLSAAVRAALHAG